MRGDWQYAADCIHALFRGGDEDKAWDGAVLVSEFLILSNLRFRKGQE